ncbi:MULTISPECIES: hypothetical protein [Planktothricoides]|uniref:Uncharacterized protein n=2 Tax=Planktothricoides raciborskii TaxID=132608 RepID=A0AAU8JGV5_9CYAN|nr:MULTISPECIES: hypothetical protein [Planktothricoides]KOR36157.1 hypothetical protein AM228_13895 [Planktothricoides sp. SR001]MBD2543733.1 hypothetical protein [Planktothricoides raciborskii FACHB-1370]MBD2582373.1 hypothetical protein [Planktothricoides raciborskii FACHB-1261]
MAIAHFPQAKKPGFCGELCRGECARRPYCGSKKETRFLEFLKGAIAFLWGAIAQNQCTESTSFAPRQTRVS